MWLSGSSNIKKVLTVSFLYFGLILPSHTQIWEAMPFQLSSWPTVFYTDTVTDLFYIAGDFKRIDSSINAPAQVMFWDGQQYDVLPPVPTPTSFPAEDIVRYKGRLYMGGWGGLSSWDGRWWRKDWGGRVIFHTSVWNDRLLAGGRFENFAGLGIGAVAAWDKQNWEELFEIDTVLSLTRFDPAIGSIVEYKGELYVGGDSDDPRPAYEKYQEIVRWNGNRWQDVGGGVFVGGDALINDMVVYKGELYVGGIFNRGGRTPGSHLIRWDGHRWRDVGGSIQGWSIEDLLVYHDELWVAGSFRGAGGIPAHNVAKWDGERWCGFGSQFTNILGPMAIFRDTLYMGGGFKSIDGDSSISYMAKWIGGAFTDSCGPRVTTDVEMAVADIGLDVWPNPVRDVLNIQIPSEVQGSVQIQILDQVGRVVQEEHKQISAKILEIEVSNLSAGIYYLSLTTPEGEFYVQKYLKIK